MQELLTGDKLIDFAKKISSKKEFDFFLQCLVRDYVDNKDEWENADLLSYLVGLCGYVNDIEGYYQNTGEKVDIDVITWRMTAEMLIAASVYE